jgi:xanthine dehydrogenase YagR molybdenum-binding subunit
MLDHRETARHRQPPVGCGSARAQRRARSARRRSWGTGGAGAGSDFPLPYIYTFPNRRRRHTDVYINAGQQRAMRAPGHPQGCFITEVLMDELADRVRMDPVEFRLQNLPGLAPNAQWRRYFPMGAERIGWNRRHVTGDPRPGPIKRGLGCSANRWGGAGTGARAHCEINPDGSVVMRCGTQDIGTACLVGIVTAETFGLTLDRVVARSATRARGRGGGGSVSVDRSHRWRASARRALAKLAEGGALARRGASRHRGEQETPQVSADREVAWKDACKLLGTTSLVVDAPWETGLSSVGTSGVQFADVEVDIETGITKVEADRVRAGLRPHRQSPDRRGQCNGGITMGIGYALFEHRILDRTTALMVNPNMEFYLMPGPSDMPEIDVTLVDMPERGIVGLGEPPTISTAAAIANAVSNAIGARIRSLPITPENVLAALARERSGGAL